MTIDLLVTGLIVVGAVVYLVRVVRAKRSGCGGCSGGCQPSGNLGDLRPHSDAQTRPEQDERQQ